MLFPGRGERRGEGKRGDEGSERRRREEAKSKKRKLDEWGRAVNRGEE